MMVSQFGIYRLEKREMLSMPGMVYIEIQGVERLAG